MDIITTARHIELAPAVREHAEKRLRKLERYANGVQEVHLIVTKEKYRHVTEVTLRANGADIISRDQSDDLLTSIDRVVDRVERQVKKLRARIKDKSRARRGAPRRNIPEPGTGSEAEAGEDTEEEPEYPPVLIPRQEVFAGDPMTVSAAVERLREQDEDVLLFRNEKTGAVSVIYVRPDGNIGFAEAL